MAILDAKTVFAKNYNMSGHGTSGSAYVLGSTAWTGAIADGGVQVVDQGKAGDAVGQELTIKAVAGADIVGSAATTVQVFIQTAGDNGLNASGVAVDSNFKDILTGPAFPVGTKCVKGTSLFECRIPGGTQRYLRAGYKVAGANVTSGTISIFATRDL